MQTFYEFIYARRRKPGLPDPLTMLHRLGIDPYGPDEIEVMRMVKAMKRAVERAPMKRTPKIALVARHSFH